MKLFHVRVGGHISKILDCVPGNEFFLRVGIGQNGKFTLPHTGNGWCVGKFGNAFVDCPIVVNGHFISRRTQEQNDFFPFVHLGLTGDVLTKRQGLFNASAQHADFNRAAECPQ